MATDLKPSRTVIDALAVPSGSAELHFFSEPSGFGIRITPGGIKTFFYQYRWAGKTRKPSIGRYGEVTPKEAQAIARGFAGKISRGIDPKAEREAEKARSLREDAERKWTLGRAIAIYLDERDLKDSTRKDMQRAFRGLSDWCNKPVGEISAAMVKSRHKKLSDASEARANLTMRYLRAVLNFVKHEAEAEGITLLGTNPVDTLSHRKAWNTVRRRNGYIPPHKLGEWLDAVASLPNQTEMRLEDGMILSRLKNGEMQRDFLRLILLTGLRLNEARGLRWDDVDLHGRTLTVRDPKNGYDHTLPIGEWLVKILEKRSRISGREYVFSDEAGHRIHNLRYAFERIELLTGLKITAHDLRRTFATIAESLGLSVYALKQALNHRTNTTDVTAGYVQVTPERLREPMQRIESFILEHASHEDEGNVVCFPKRNFL